MASSSSDKLWRYMQNHFENTLHASPCVTFSGDVDKIRADEGAVVIAVSRWRHPSHSASLLTLSTRIIKAMPTTTLFTLWHHDVQPAARMTVHRKTCFLTVKACSGNVAISPRKTSSGRFPSLVGLCGRSA